MYLLIMAGVLVLLSGAGAVRAQSSALRGGPAAHFPNKPIRWVTGGGPDAMARVLGQKFTDAWGQQIVIEERGGGGGMMSADLVARATPDGYTLLLATGTHTISPNYFKMSYSMERDFAAVSLLGTITFILSVHPSLPVKSVEELLALAKAKPGEINYTSGGTGSPAHIITEYLRLKTGINVIHVPYRTVGQAVTGLIGNQAQFMFVVSPASVPQVKAGRLRGLAVTALKRSPAVPDLPTMVEAGVADFEALAWNGLMVPAKTPRDIINKLHAESAKSLKLPDVQERIAALGFEAVGNTPQAFAIFLKSELDKWARVAKATGAKAE
ncbi:MAG TPA: tripartite tricarboxylate transporter substrate binding protein [Burkholderiales bacterium]|nr:tripartite tricarboxylate transporter substrate binding protein [Burkholderiales bacterium]